MRAQFERPTSSDAKSSFRSKVFPPHTPIGVHAERNTKSANQSSLSAWKRPLCRARQNGLLPLERQQPECTKTQQHKRAGLRNHLELEANQANQVRRRLRRPIDPSRISKRQRKQRRDPVAHAQVRTVVVVTRIRCSVRPRPPPPQMVGGGCGIREDKDKGRVPPASRGC